MSKEKQFGVTVIGSYSRIIEANSEEEAEEIMMSYVFDPAYLKEKIQVVVKPINTPALASFPPPKIIWHKRR